MHPEWRLTEERQHRALSLSRPRRQPFQQASGLCFTTEQQPGRVTQGHPAHPVLSDRDRLSGTSVGYRAGLHLADQHQRYIHQSFLLQRLESPIAIFVTDRAGSRRQTVLQDITADGLPIFIPVLYAERIFILRCASVGSAAVT